MAASWLQTAARSATSTQDLTEAEPTGTDGIPLDAVKSVAVVLRAPVGQTLTGAGKLLLYFRRGGVWAPAQRGHIPLDDVAGLSNADLPIIPIDAPRDRMALIASGVGVSGGTQVTVELYGVVGPGTEAA